MRLPLLPNFCIASLLRSQVKLLWGFVACDRLGYPNWMDVYPFERLFAILLTEVRLAGRDNAWQI